MIYPFSGAGGDMQTEKDDKLPIILLFEFGSGKKPIESIVHITTHSVCFSAWIFEALFVEIFKIILWAQDAVLNSWENGTKTKSQTWLRNLL